MGGCYFRIDPEEKKEFLDLMNKGQLKTNPHISADSITLTITKLSHATTCKYCGSVIEGKRCESCGAPRQGG